jgi:hypothetical protein
VRINCKEFTYTSDAAFQADVTAWFDTLRAGGTPVRDFRVNFVTTTRVLVTALFGMA